MPALSLAAAETQTGAYQLGQIVVYLVVAAAVIGALVFANKRRLVDREKRRVAQEQESLQQTKLSRALQGRITYGDGRAEDLQTTLAQLPDLVMTLQATPNTVVEIRDSGRGTVRISFGQGTATVSWESLGKLYRHRASHVADSAGPDERYRLSIGDAIAVLQAWAGDSSASGNWERAEPGPVVTA